MVIVFPSRCHRHWGCTCDWMPLDTWYAVGHCVKLASWTGLHTKQAVDEVGAIPCLHTITSWRTRNMHVVSCVEIRGVAWYMHACRWSATIFDRSLSQIRVSTFSRFLYERTARYYKDIGPTARNPLHSFLRERSRCHDRVLMRDQ